MLKIIFNVKSIESRREISDSYVSTMFANPRFFTKFLHSLQGQVFGFYFLICDLNSLSDSIFLYFKGSDVPYYSPKVS